MIINKIVLEADAFVHCSSSFYSARCTLSENSQYLFNNGLNLLVGEIDSGAWAADYVLSMHQYRTKDIVFTEQPALFINDETAALEEIFKYSCYMDKLYPLFSSRKTVKRIITDSCKHKENLKRAEEIIDMFKLSDNRLDRPIKETGNEAFQAMAAIGYSCGKQVYCFPWMSRDRYNYYRMRLQSVIDTLKELNMIVIMPIGLSNDLR